MSTPVKTKTEKVMNMFSGGKKVKVDTVAKKLYGSNGEVEKDRARRIINYVATNYLDVELVEEGTYQAQ